MPRPILPPMLADATRTPSAVDRALAVLAALAQHGSAMTAADLMQRTGLSQSTLYRQLATLKRWGFVQELQGRYAPGPLGLQLALGFDMASHVVQQARAEMQALAQQSQESVGLVMAVNGQAVCVEMIESRQSLRCSFEKGRSVPLDKGASARCLMAHLPEGVLQPLLAAHARPKVLAAELAAIRKAGCAVSDGEVDPGVWGVSGPLFGPGRRALAALTLMAPSVRVQSRRASLIQMTLLAASRISRSLDTP